ncbi:MarR family winged helix-turn-helix transcriptional regulator [Alkalicoccus halolimnae]|uniref:MarR family transcriptional regulator n=1 Tax=Alkalicoccus halolimnae TaxID=1667239 RepID=A0AAJ8LW20_9BACI|nr:MarR family transcriptional regulator [Alkalicoccus halolimnae]
MNRKMNEVIGYQLGATAHLLHNEHNRSLAAHGLTRSQVKVLYLLQSYGLQSQAQLQKQLFIQGSTMNGLLESLLKSELVEKTASRSDRRQKLISLTEKGRTLEKTVWREAMQIEEKVTDFLSEEEKQYLLQTLKTMQGKLQKETEEQRNE